MSKTPKTTKYRIFELAKEFNQDSQFLLDFLKKRKIKVANRFSAVDEEVYAMLKESLPRRKATVETPTESKTESAPKTAATPARPARNYNDKPKINVKPRAAETGAKTDSRPVTRVERPITRVEKPV